MKSRNRFITRYVSVLAFVCASLTILAEVTEDGYIAYVDMPYGLSAGKGNVFTFGGEEATKYKIPGLIVNIEKVSYEDAVNKFESKYQEAKGLLSAGYDGNVLGRAVQLSSLSSWQSICESAIRKAEYQQKLLDAKYIKALTDSIKNDGYSHKDVVSTIRTETKSLADEMKDLWQTFRSSHFSIRSDIRGQQANLSALSEDTAAKQKATNGKIAELEQKDGELTQQEERLLQNLKEQASELAIVKAMADTAQTEAQKALSEAEQAASEAYWANAAVTNSLNDITKWLGYKEDGEAGGGLWGGFMTPQVFDQKLADGSAGGVAAPAKEYYDLGNQTYLTMLADAGIIPLLTKKGVELWTKLAGKEPNVYMLYDEEGEKKNGNELKGVAKDKLLAMSNLVDMATITINEDGKYSSDANVAATIEAWLNKGGLSAKLKGATKEKSDDNLWSTNNPANPANALFDENSPTNIWNLLKYKGDNEAADLIGKQELEEWEGAYPYMHSVDFFGSGKNYGDSRWLEYYGNAFSLHGFFKTENGMIPYVNETKDEDEWRLDLDWHKELEGTSENSLYESETNSLPDTVEVFYVESDKYKDGVEESEFNDYILGKNKRRRILALKGCDDAEVGQVPYKKEKAGLSGQYTLGWKSVDTKFVGTDGSTNWVDGEGNTNTNTPGQTVTFASATNSNVKVEVKRGNDDDEVTITIGVYYK